MILRCGIVLGVDISGPYTDGSGKFKFKFSSIFRLLFIKLSFPERYGPPDKIFEISAKHWL